MEMEDEMEEPSEHNPSLLRVPQIISHFQQITDTLMEPVHILDDSFALVSMEQSLQMEMQTVQEIIAYM